jgi:hypothetical protein
MKRRIVALVLALAIALPLAASVTNGTRGLRTASTEHFDIIYQEKSKETAALLYNNCEDLYASLVEFFDFDPKLHIPVTVTGEYKTLNAYYTSSPANRIVMFDTISEDGQLSVFPQTILDVFRHELTHAFQFNMRGPFINFLSKVIGDIVSISPFIYMTPSLSEGGAVLSESAGGYGRINDSYAMQIVKQAKIEGLFPNFVEVAGSRDTYPSGLLYYNFSACFLQYLADNYGLANIASLWPRMGKPGFFESLNHMFKERTGKGIQELWDDFYESVEIPESIEAEPVKAGSFASPVLASDGEVYLYEGAIGSVVRLVDGKNGGLKTEKIFYNPTNEINLSISADGTRILIPYIQEFSAAVRLYDISKGSKLLKTFKPEEDDATFRSGCFVTLDGVEYILLAMNKGQRNSFLLYDAETLEPVEGKRVDLGYDAVASYLTTAGDGRAAFVLRAQALDRMAFLDVRTMEVRALENPDGIRIMSLSKGTDGEGEVLSFVWYPDDARSTNLGRYGEIRLADVSDGEAVVRLSDVDVSGSLGQSIRIGDELLFASRYYDTRKLSTIDVSDLEIEADGSILNLSKFDESMAPGIDYTALSEASKKYHTIKYFKDGLFFPSATVSFGDGLTFGGIGVNWMTMDPTETFQHTIDFGLLDGGLGGSYTLDWTSSPLRQIRARTVYGIYDSEEATLPYGSLVLGAGASLYLLELELGDPSTTLFVGDAYDVTALRTSDGDFSFSHKNVLAASFSFSRSVGSGLYEGFGFGAVARLENIDPSLTLKIVLPRLMWWRCIGRTVTNLPSSFSAMAKYFINEKAFLFSESASVTLFSQEIQRGIYFMHLYSHRFTVVADFVANQRYLLESETLDYANKLSVSANLFFTPAFGEFLTNAQLALNLTVETNFNGWNPATDFNGLGVTISFGLYRD